MIDTRVDKSVHTGVCYFHKNFKEAWKAAPELSSPTELHCCSTKGKMFHSLHLLKLEACEYSPWSQIRANSLLTMSVPSTKARNGRGGLWEMLTGRCWVKTDPSVSKVRHMRSGRRMCYRHQAKGTGIPMFTSPGRTGGRSGHCGGKEVVNLRCIWGVLLLILQKQMINLFFILFFFSYQTATDCNSSMHGK